MFQCGFLIPALENSELPVFDSLFIDIGDQQSIDNDLGMASFGAPSVLVEGLSVAGK